MHINGATPTAAPELFSTEGKTRCDAHAGRRAEERRGDGHQSARRRRPRTTSRARRTGRRTRRSATAACSSRRSRAARTPRNPSVMLAAGLLAKKAVERGLNGESGGEDLARAGLARRHRLPQQDRPPDVSRPARFPDRRLRLHHLHRQLAARSIPRSRKPSRRTISSPPACSAATATSRRACIRTSRRTSSCRRRSSSPSPSPAASIST